MKIYIAAPWVHKDRIPDISAKFEAIGCEVTHKWWITEDIQESERTAGALYQQAVNDYLGVVRADLLVLINSDKSEGKAVEQGVAIANDKPIIAVGKRGEVSKNVFHYLENYFWVDTVEDAVRALDLIGWLTRYKNASESE